MTKSTMGPVPSLVVKGKTLSRLVPTHSDRLQYSDSDRPLDLRRILSVVYYSTTTACLRTFGPVGLPPWTFVAGRSDARGSSVPEVDNQEVPQGPVLGCDPRVARRLFIPIWLVGGRFVSMSVRSKVRLRCMK